MITFNRFQRKSSALVTGIALMLGSVFGTAQAASADIANMPMAVSNMVTPNLLVVYDNSQSMDAQMNGVMISGNGPTTRGNIGRYVMRNAMTAYRTSFNWGLMSYEMGTNPPNLYSTYVYYLGSDTGMVFTSDCSGYTAGTFNGSPAIPGTSAAGGGRCIANPQPSTGREYITFNYSSDDSNIVDVLYYGGYAGSPAYNQMWAPALNTSTPTTYKWYQNHSTTVSTWNEPADFSSSIFSATLTPTDAGFLPSNSGASLPNNISRSLYMPRGWGYLSGVTGKGKLNSPIETDSTTHFNALQALLANETNGTTGELKNGAVYTTLKGTLDSAKTYFESSYSGNSSPVSAACQQNFVMLVTDGLPTGDTSGDMYSSAARTNTCAWSTSSNSCSSGAFGSAATDTISAVNALRTTSVSGKTSILKDGSGSVTGKFDVQTYVVALGDTVANAGALSVMNAMAYNGGTDKAIAAGDANAFANAITTITDDISAKVGSSAAVAVANAHVTSSDNASYASSYNSGTWTGDINAYAIDVLTGIPSLTPSWAAGSAATQLDLRTSANRFIATSTGIPGSIGGLQFQATAATTATKLSAAQQTLLNTPSTTDGASVLAYLRGDRSGETSGTYRVRAHLLGDLINGEPVLLREPYASYVDIGYGTFKTNKASRTRVLFQGSNDGMLHAFVATTGAESWAYVPNLVLSNLNNLSLKAGFTHKYSVDGTPVTGDVDFGNMSSAASNAAADWRTILVGGLGKGGRGYYALDVTTPTATSEVDVKNKVLWEFPYSITNATARASAILNMGYSFGKPIIVKTQAKGWVVLVTSGYNNGTNTGDSGGDGLGHLYVLDPKTGDLIKDIVTSGGSASSPSGLAQISAYVASSDQDNTAEYVYGGDLLGNIWRFDLTGNSVGNTASTGWTVSLFTTLKDASGTVQPITTAPELTLLSGSRMVYVGTGLYLGTSDVSTTQTQTIYALKDTLTGLPTPLRSNLLQKTYVTSTDLLTKTLSSNTVDYATQKGWYFDLPVSGERINTDPVLVSGKIVLTSNVPSSATCSPGGKSYKYELDAKNGTGFGVFLADALASRPVVIQLPSGKLVALVRTSDATTRAYELPGASSSISAKRVSWRELFN